MIVIGIDVGISTGIVITSVERRRTIPVIEDSMTLEYGSEDFGSVLDQAGEFLDAYPALYVLVEYPFLTKLNNQASKITALRDRWAVWLSNFYKHLPAKQVISVAPATWKQTPSKDVDLFRMQQRPAWIVYKPTRHELDAAAMTHWFSYWRL